MNVAVKLYQDMPADTRERLCGMPGTCPALVKENCDIAPDSTWMIMAVEDYRAYKAAQDLLISPETLAQLTSDV